MIGVGLEAGHPLSGLDIIWPLKRLLALMFHSTSQEHYDLEALYRYLEWIAEAPKEFVDQTAYFFQNAPTESLRPGGSEKEIADDIRRLSALIGHYQNARDWFNKTRLALVSSFHYEYYVDVSRGSEAGKVYLPLLQLLEDLNCTDALNVRSPLKVFTLNWDTAWEALRDNEIAKAELHKILGSSANADPIAEGFRLVGRDWVFERDTLQQQMASSRMTLVRLHGSIRWRRHRDSKEVRYAADPGFPLPYTGQEPCLIYPGGKFDLIEKEPWASLFEIFKKELQNAQVLLIIGYSFRDGHVNQLLLEGMDANSSLQILAANPTEFPKLSTADIFATEFFQRVDKDRFSHVPKPWPDALDELKTMSLFEKSSFGQ